MSLTILMTRGRWTLGAGLGTGLLAVAALGLAGQHSNVAGLLVSDLLTVATYVLLSVVVTGAVFAPGRFTGYRVRGAVVLYLNLGLLFAVLHRITAALAPGAYANLPGISDEAAFHAALNYFSFTTLTSVGYGDILPVQPFARSLSNLEGMVGQIFPATLLARVVTLRMDDREV